MFIDKILILKEYEHVLEDIRKALKATGSTNLGLTRFMSNPENLLASIYRSETYLCVIGNSFSNPKNKKYGMHLIAEEIKRVSPQSIIIGYSGSFFPVEEKDTPDVDVILHFGSPGIDEMGTANFLRFQQEHGFEPSWYPLIRILTLDFASMTRQQIISVAHETIDFASL